MDSSPEDGLPADVVDLRSRRRLPGATKQTCDLLDALTASELPPDLQPALDRTIQAIAALDSQEERLNLLSALTEHCPVEAEDQLCDSLVRNLPARAPGDATFARVPDVFRLYVYHKNQGIGAKLRKAYVQKAMEPWAGSN